MTDPIDYSRPVGWWCLHCDESFPCERVRMWLPMACKLIPRYLPIPEGQRPLVDDEVDSEEAEVSSWIVDWEEKTYICYTGNYHDHIQPYTTSVDKEPTAEEIRFIVTGATE